MTVRMKKRTANLFLTVFLILPLAALQGQEKAPSSRLNLERIFGTREFVAERFGPVRWTKDGRSFTTVEDSATVKGGKDIVLYMAATGKREVIVSASRLIPPGSSSPLDIQNYFWSDDGRLLLIFTNGRRVWRQNTRGDFWTLDRVSGTLKKLGATFEPSTLQFAKLSPSGRRAAYVHKNDIFAEDIDSGSIVRLTFDGSETTINGTGDWVYEEELRLRDGFRWSPDGKFIAFWQLDSSGVKDFYMINNTDTLYPKIVPIKYPMAGEKNSACRIGVVNSSGGPVTWLNSKDDPRDYYIARMDWAPNSKEVIFQRLNRLQNANEVMIGDVSSGEVRTIFTDRDETWVEIVDEFRWLNKGRDLIWESERDGWNHAYRVSRGGGEIKLITPGDFDVIDVAAVDEKNGWLYYLASPDNATQRYLFRSRLEGKGKPEQLSPAGAPGTHSYQISPTCEWAVHTYSAFDSPPTVDLARLPKHIPVRALVENKTLKDKVRALDRKSAEFFRIDIGDGVLLDGWCLKPPDFDPSKSYPLLVYVYGGPGAQTVLDRWDRETYFWHLMLAQQGYLIISIDNRGTPAPRGRQWRKCIFHQIGVLAPADQAAAIKALIKKWPYVDASRIGIWGWSGGAGMTLHALFKYPDLYKTGMAVAFVSDIHLYDTIYQERYMGLPLDNEEAYKNGSPINFAGQLKGKLLLVHGTGDDNVHFQNFERLANELIAANKPFSMMIYPNRTHGISEGKNTALHLYETLTSYLLRNLPPGPRPPDK